MADLNPDHEENEKVSARYRGKEIVFDDTDRIILDHAYKHFDTHAKSRTDNFRSFLIVSALAFASFATLWREDAYFACAVIAFAFVFINLTFYMLDIRALQLLKLSERALAVSHARLAAACDWSDLDRDKIELFRQSDYERYLVETHGIKVGKITTRDVYYKIFSLMMIVSIIAFVASVSLLVPSAE